MALAVALILALAFAWSCSSAKKPDKSEGSDLGQKKTTGEPGQGPKDTAQEQSPADSPSAQPVPQKIERKLLLVGLDGATWTLIDPLLERGLLPHFQKLIDQGSRVPLKTFEPTASPLIWTTIATGMSYEKHGIGDFIVKIPGSDEAVLPTSNLRRVKAIWNILSDGSYSVGVTGWWATYPAENVRGYIISDQANTLRNKSYRIALDIDSGGADSNLQTFPRELQAEIDRTIAASPHVGAKHLSRFMNLPKKSLERLRKETVTIDVHDIGSVFRVALLIDQAFIEAGLLAMEKQKTDFSAIYLNGLDAAEHHFWKFIEPEKFKNVDPKETSYYRNLIEQYYVYMDETLGRLLRIWEGQNLTVMVVSDHGHEANPQHDPQSTDKFHRICSGTHEKAPDGVLILSGKDIRKKAELNQTSVYDIAPTILALMGMPVGRDMPGRVIEEAIESDFLKNHPITWTPTHSAGWTYDTTPVRSVMGETLKEKLRGLGYIQ